MGCGRGAFPWPHTLPWQHLGPGHFWSSARGLAQVGLVSRTEQTTTPAAPAGVLPPRPPPCPESEPSRGLPAGKRRVEAALFHQLPAWPGGLLSAFPVTSVSRRS